MSKQPRIVAELGRPETPDETAARKAAATRKHYANQTFTNLLLATAASIAVIVVIMLAVLRPDPAPREPVDVAAAAGPASAALGEAALAPEVPEGFWSNSAELRTATGGIRTWNVGYITPSERFLGLTQAIDANPTWLANEMRIAAPTGTTTIGGVEWQVYDQRGADDVGLREMQLTTVVGDTTIVVFGTADDDELMPFALAVSERLDSLRAPTP